MNAYQSPRRTVLTILVIAGLALGSAQGERYVDASIGFGLTIPAGWAAQAAPSDTGGTILTLTARNDAGLIVVFAEPLSPAQVTQYEGASPDAVIDEVWQGFAPEVPGARIDRTLPLLVDGVDARAIEYVGDGLGGTVVAFVVQGAAIYTLASAGMGVGRAEVDAAFQLVVASLALPATPGSSGSPNPLAPPAPTATNPLAPAAPVNPLAPAAPVNPLAPAAPVNPLAPAAPVNPLAPANPLAPSAPANPLAPPAPANPLAPPAPTNPLAPAAAVNPFAPPPPTAPVDQDRSADATAAAADPFAGTFEGDGARLELAGSRGLYIGQLQLGDAVFVVRAVADGDFLDGSYERDGARVAWSAVVDGALMLLVTEGAAYTLSR